MTGDVGPQPPERYISRPAPARLMAASSHPGPCPRPRMLCVHDPQFTSQAGRRAPPRRAVPGPGPASRPRCAGSRLRDDRPPPSPPAADAGQARHPRSLTASGGAPAPPFPALSFPDLPFPVLYFPVLPFPVPPSAGLRRTTWSGASPPPNSNEFVGSSAQSPSPRFPFPFPIPFTIHPPKDCPVSAGPE